MEQVVLTSIDLNELVQLLTKNIEDIILNKKEVVINQVVNTEQKSEYLTRKEVAEICKVTSLTTLWNWEQKGKLVPKRKAGKKPLYLRQDVENFLKGNNRGSILTAA
ncbi:helix-turn-helix domain-containing protein [Tamlana sp. s12]|uniref:helix-turn-helix transcriptional regulator n=1 Tax=Tamlana sp. s12 TaxID=1630406 RepID=UPI000838FE85|nr:helix-turn-helix domain-containing protein [Tamlana sp. s12]QQY81860.1 helix-turn-helix domain-containing protein [Tamlana sp. s12]